MTTALMGTEHYIYRRDGKIYVYKVGGGEPVIFLHAVGQSGWSWRKVLDQFARHLTCYSIDLPGFDHSDIPPKSYSIDGDYPQAIVDVMDGLGLEQATIIADRTGLIIAAILAAQHPRRVKRLVLGGLPFWDKEHGEIIWERWFMPMFTDTTSYHVPVAALTTWEEAKAKDPELEFEEWEKNEEIKQKSRLWSRMSQQAHSGYDIESVGPKVSQPTLLIYGEHDGLRRTEQRAHESIKGSVLRIMPGLAGSPHEKKPDEFVKLVLEFLGA